MSTEETPGVTLTQAQADTLERIVELVERFGESDNCKGMFPTGAGGWATMRSLERRGLVAYRGDGRDIDGNGGRDVQIFGITAKGFAALEHHRALTGPLPGVPGGENPKGVKWRS